VTLASSVAVIGGGIIGTTAAWRLAQRGWRIVLYEQSRIGSEASWAGAGMLAPGGEIDEHTADTKLLVRSRDLYRGFVGELRAETSVVIDYQECGALDLAYTKEHWAYLQARSERESNLGIRMRLLTPSHVSTLSPHVNSGDLAGACFYPDDGLVDPRQIMEALHRACDLHGVEVRENSPVTQVHVASDNVQIGAERYSAALMAAGAWSSGIVVNGVQPLPASEPVKGQLLAFDLPVGICPTMLRHDRVYMLQRSNGLLVLGSSIQRLGFHREIDPSISKFLTQEGAKFFPVLGGLEPVDIWTGFRPGAERLQLGRWQQSRLFLAYGHFRNGILLAPVTAELIADEMSQLAQ
jgi:glycine oxidase